MKTFLNRFFKPKTKSYSEEEVQNVVNQALTEFRKAHYQNDFFSEDYWKETVGDSSYFNSVISKIKNPKVSCSDFQIVS